MQRERLTEMAGYRASVKSGDFFATQRHLRLLRNLAEQTSRIIARAHLIRLTLLGLLGAVCLMIVSSLMNGVAMFWPGFAVGAAIAFVGGMLSLLLGVITAMRELREALDVVKLESQLVTDLTDSDHLPGTSSTRPLARVLKESVRSVSPALILFRRKDILVGE